MSSTVRLVIVFDAFGPAPAQALAARFLAELGVAAEPVGGEGEAARRQFAHEEAARFLGQLAEGTCYSRGVRGGMFVWANVTSHVVVDDIVDVLRPFWRELLWGAMVSPRRQGEPYPGPYPDSSILILYHRDTSPHAGALEIGLEGADRQEDWEDAADEHWRPELAIRRHDTLPFALF